MSAHDYRAIKLEHACEAFLETGYYHGSGVRRALDAGFTDITSIEISSKYVRKAYLDYPNEIAANTVRIIQDDSINMYKHIAHKNVKFMFFLDAHADQDLTHEQGLYKCPVIAELREIAKHKKKNHVILIDDMRIFRSQKDWSNGIVVNALVEELQKINPNYVIKFLNGYAADDVLYAYVPEFTYTNP